jgi:hypothetical protein
MQRINRRHCPTPGRRACLPDAEGFGHPLHVAARREHEAARAVAALPDHKLAVWSVGCPPLPSRPSAGQGSAAQAAPSQSARPLRVGHSAASPTAGRCGDSAQQLLLTSRPRPWTKLDDRAQSTEHRAQSTGERM